MYWLLPFDDVFYPPSPHLRHPVTPLVHPAGHTDCVTQWNGRPHKMHLQNCHSRQAFHARAAPKHCHRRVAVRHSSVRQAGPSTPVPDYTAIDQQALNQLVMSLFRRKMVAAIGRDSQLTG